MASKESSLASQRQYIIRDISWLAFNARVLQEAGDATNHIYDRLRFLGIFSNNLDEFFRVRVATLNRMLRLGKAAKVHLEENPDKILQKILDNVNTQQKQFDYIYGHVVQELAKQNIFIKNEKQLSPHQQKYVTDLFDEQIRTRIVPLMIESIPNLPLLNDKSIYLACVLGDTRNPLVQRYALISIPTRMLPRFVILPSEPGTKDIILLEDIVRFNLQNLFAPFGFDRFLGYIIKVTRDAEIDLDNDVTTDLIAKIEKGIKNRKKGRTTRFVYDRTIDQNLKEYLVRRLGMTNKDNLIAGGRIHNFKDFMDFPPSVFRDLESRPRPFVHPLLKQPVRIMKVMEERDVMLHFPYHSFDSLIDLLREAAIDPYVQSIKITCYRMAKESKMINALINAVRNGKQVTVMLELRARFDEEANLHWKEELEEAGVKVLLGVPEMKIHAKLCIIKKREFNTTKQYGFISTGNFNENTARFYGDHCLLTTNRTILADINRIFTYLESAHHRIEHLKACKVLPVAPFNMRKTFLSLIDKEIRTAKKGKSASMIIKLNSIVDKELIEKIYEAARAGVDTKLIIRGICCANTELKGVKKNLEAISIIDEYLEHARVFIFDNGKKPEVFISSADWMVRNLDHRIEAACPIYDKNIKQELIDILNIQLAENVKGRILDEAQDNEYVQRGKDEAIVRSQLATYQYLKNKEYDH
ncbi:MAG TPA: polyphosphate kinase 1 [Flavipsychrobacter sp.]|nr:polyphosphate kinase 1 [Flavipsychrobacter sp.]